MDGLLDLVRDVVAAFFLPDVDLDLLVVLAFAFVLVFAFVLAFAFALALPFASVLTRGFAPAGAGCNNDPTSRCVTTSVGASPSIRRNRPCAA